VGRAASCRGSPGHSRRSGSASVPFCWCSRFRLSAAKRAGIAGWNSRPLSAFASGVVPGTANSAFVELLDLIVGTGEVVHASERVGMFGTELDFPKLQRLLQEAARPRSSFPVSLYAFARLFHAGERAGDVRGPSLAFMSFSVSLEERHGQVQLPGRPDTPRRGCS